MPLFVVGIGASAGGLEALVELLGALPTTGFAFIVVQHLDPTHESLLAEILAKKTAMPVLEAVAGQRLQADHVYVIPPDAILTVHDGRIDLKPRKSAGERPSPVDALFSSLAASYGDCAIGVVLSGGDADGSLGIRDIKHAGGFTFAQRPESARFPVMPRHAIDTGCVDVALRPREIAREIARVSRRLQPAEPMTGAGSTSPPDLGAADENAALAPIFQRLRVSHGVDFAHYKRSTIRRRIERRMMLQRMERLDEYAALVDHDPAEAAALYQDFLIRVTEFFRDPVAFDALRQHVFPALCEGRSVKRPIRIWVPGCSTGEEVYSIAIVLLEYLGDRLSTLGIQIFGTDVSDVALQKARAGVYRPDLLHDVSAERLERFFVKENDESRIGKNLRDLCLFARHDVTRDPPFSRLDLISCRNLLIYLDDVAQRRVLRAFHYALRPQGILFFGSAESAALLPELFQQVDSRSRVFRRMPNTGRGAIAEPANVPRSQALEPEESDVPLASADALPREADRLLLARFAPASVLVNQALTVLQFRGHTGPYLEPAGGPPSFDLRRVIRPELLVQVLPAISETNTTGVPCRRDARLDDREIGIEVIPMLGSNGGQALLILFDDRSRPAENRRVPSAASPLPESDKDRRLAQLERESEGLRDYLRAAIEDHGAVQEELRSAHEEMLSANEEYQSTNEELETSKEELQSTNEELTTTIDELRSRNQELATLNAALDETRRASEAARAYADSIIETVREPLAVLDDALRILRVNSAFASSLNVPREEIEGRLLHQVGAGRWNIPELQKRLIGLLADAQPLEDWEVTLNVAGEGRRVVSLSARRIPGGADRHAQLLLALEDVTARADMTAGLLATSEKKDEFIAMLGHELRHPLTPITHATYLLRRGNLDPASAELLDAIDTQSQRLLRFVNDLLDVTRISRGLIEIRPERVDFAAIAREAVDPLQPLVQERRHALSLVLPATPVYVSGDAGRLSQVITNLVENAVNYTDSGGRITVTLEQRGEAAVLRVRDNGSGIAPENLERVFQTFSRSPGALGSPSGGLGLGLSVVRRIVELHGGHVTATSGGLQMGSEFIVSLPVWAADTGDAPPSGRAVDASVPVATVRTRRVMIVDDHEEIRTSVSRLVRAWGHEVAVASDGPNALALADAFQPETAIVDIALPGMDGITLARRLRERFPPGQLYLIALTGYTDPGLRERCLAAGFDVHLVKPGQITLLGSLLGQIGETSQIPSRELH